MNKWEYAIPGIPDACFIRDERVPMTKNEIRVLSLVKLRLFPEAIIYDIGAGSGSVAIECKIAAPRGQVFAIEKDPVALHLIERNSRRFEVEVAIIPGVAPEALEPLPKADRIFIGGSGGRLDKMIHASHDRLKPGGYMVINSVTLHTGPDAYNMLKMLGYEVEAIQVNIAALEPAGSTQIWRAKNPVMIVAGRKRER